MGVLSRSKSKKRIAFLGEWLKTNLNVLFPGGGVTFRTELRSTSSGTHKRGDGVLFMNNMPDFKRYVLMEMDDAQHARLGLV